MQISSHQAMLCSFTTTFLLFEAVPSLPAVMGSNVVVMWQQVVGMLRDATKDPASCADPSVFSGVNALVSKLLSLPGNGPPPKSVWKKLIQQKQVPLHIATALSTATQHSPKSPGTQAALEALQALLRIATESGLIKDGVAAAVGSLGNSMRQQLQQAGVMQPLAIVMAALAAELRSEAATIAGLSGEELRSNLQHCTATRVKTVWLLAKQLPHFMGLWVSQGAAASNSSAYLCDSSGHAEAAMQLCTAALQHASSMLQYVIPAVQHRAPQQAAKLLQQQHARVSAALGFGHDLVVALFSSRPDLDGPPAGTSSQYVQGAAMSGQAQQQQQMLSPHCLPLIASLLLLSTLWVANALSLPKATGSQGLQGMSSSSSGSGSGNAGSSRGSGGRSASDSSSSTGSSGSVVCGDTLSPCQLQLMELLSLSPQLAAVVQQLPGCGVTVQLIETGAHYITTVGDWVLTAPRPQAEVDKQRWQFEQQVLLLLPSVLLRYANTYLSWATHTPDDPCELLAAQLCVEGLVEYSGRALLVSNQLQEWLGGSPPVCRPPYPAWIGEALGGALQLADQVLPQQQPQVQAPGDTQTSSSTSTAANSGTGTVLGTSTNTSTSTVLSTSTSRTASRRNSGVRCVERLTYLLSMLVHESSRWLVLPMGHSTGGMLHEHSSTSNPTCAEGSAGVAAAAAAAGPLLSTAGSTPSVPVVAERFVEVCRALEAGLRVITAARQSGTLGTSMASSVVSWCLQYLFLGTAGGLAMHSRLCGPEASALEQRQFYSLLSTVQKLCCCQAGGQLCWAEDVAYMCCWVAAAVAVQLLQKALLTTTSAEAQAAAVEQQHQQQPEEYLPSLVIFGRSCVVWAKQLRQQAPALLALLAGSASVQQQQQQQQQQQGGVHVAYSAARMCIPGLLEGTAAATAPPCRLEGLVGKVSSWVCGTTSPAAQAALAAAAGGDKQQFRQQLEALAAAQKAVRQEGVSDASLAALAQQLQATGVMLNSIAVPHFCNNPACVNISGPTEVQLVSGRSCICAGCRTARYCGRVCQRQAWRQHKPVCKALAAAAAAAQV